MSSMAGDMQVVCGEGYAITHQIFKEFVVINPSKLDQRF